MLTKWSNVIFIYKQEGNNIANNTPLDYQAFYPNTLEKQKVLLVMNIFKKKVIFQLEH